MPVPHTMSDTQHPAALISADELDRYLSIFLAHSSDPELHVRHTAALDKLCRVESFVVRQLPTVVQILRIAVRLAGSQHAATFLEPACGLVRAVGRPYTRQSTTDELKLLAVLASVLKALRHVFDGALPWQLQACTAQVLADFASVWGNRPACPVLDKHTASVADVQSVQRTYQMHQSLLQESCVVPSMCAALAAAVRQGSASTTNTTTSSSSSNTVTSAAFDGSTDTSQHECNSSSSSQLVTPILAALLECSFCAELCEQQLHAGILPVLSQLLVAQAVVGGSLVQQGGMCARVTELLLNLLEFAGPAADAFAATHQGSTEVQHQQHHQAEEQQQEQPDQQRQPQTPPQPPLVEACQLQGAPAGAAVGQHQHKDDSSSDASTPSADAAAATPGEQAGMQDTILAGASPADQLVAALAALLQQQFRSDGSLQAKQQRNDTLSVLCHASKCASFVPAIAGNSSLVALLLVAASRTTPAAGIACAPGPASSAGKASNTTSNESSLEADHTMQLLSWTILGNTAAVESGCLVAVLQAGLLDMLMLVAGQGAGAGSSAAGSGAGGGSRTKAAPWWVHLTPEQLRASEQLAWSVLLQLAPLCKSTFMSSGATSMLLKSLEAFSCGGSSTGNSGSWLAVQAAMAPNYSARRAASPGSHASSGGTTSLGTVLSALRLLQRLVHADAAAATAVAGEGGVAVLLQLLQAPAAATQTPVRQGVLLVLSELCSAGGRGCLGAVRQASGVGLLLKECQRILDGDPYVPSLAALGCVWRCCLPSARSRTQLLAADGLDTLLCLLQRGTPALQPVLLSLLADLLSDKRAHKFFWEWYAPAAAGGSGWSSHSSSFSAPCARPLSGGSVAAARGLPGGGGCSDDGRPAAAAAGSSIMSSILAAAADISNGQGAPWILALCSGSMTSCSTGNDSIIGGSISGGGGSSRGSNSITAAKLLLDVWRRQDEALGVSGPDGTLANPARPLTGTKGRQSHRPAAAALRPAAATAGGAPARAATPHGSAAASSRGMDTAGMGGGALVPACDDSPLLPTEQRAVAACAVQAGSPAAIMEKVYACFAALGVAGTKDSSSVQAPEGIRALQALPLEDAAVLAVIQQYVCFRQGEVWRDISSQLEEEGVQPTQEDSARLESGIRHAEMVAAQVQATQAALLGAGAVAQLKAERVLYANMAAQLAADVKSRVYEKDISKLTMRERLAAKAQKEEMLQRLRPVPMQAHQ